MKNTKIIPVKGITGGRAGEGIAVYKRRCYMQSRKMVQMNHLQSRNRDIWKEQTYGHQGGKEGVGCIGRLELTYIHPTYKYIVNENL